MRFGSSGALAGGNRNNSMRRGAVVFSWRPASGPRVAETAMAIELRYGKGSIRAELPGGCRETVIRKAPRAPLRDPHGAVAEALARPIGAPALSDHARGK